MKNTEGLVFFHPKNKRGGNTKVAVVGSRNLNVNIENYIPSDTTLIISGGAKGIDQLAEAYANKHKIPIQTFLPNYQMYGKAAPLVRNKEIVNACDILIAIWDGKSKGTKFTIDFALKEGKTVKVYEIKTEEVQSKKG